jgi:hypothetical protein
MHFFSFFQTKYLPGPSCFSAALMLIQLLLKVFPVIKNYKFSSLEGHPYLENSVTFGKKMEWKRQELLAGKNIKKYRIWKPDEKQPNLFAMVFYFLFVSHRWCDLFYRLLHSYTRHMERVVRGERDTFLSAQE